MENQLTARFEVWTCTAWNACSVTQIHPKRLLNWISTESDQRKWNEHIIGFSLKLFHDIDSQFLFPSISEVLKSQNEKRKLNKFEINLFNLFKFSMKTEHLKRFAIKFEEILFNSMASFIYFTNFLKIYSRASLTIQIIKVGISLRSSKCNMVSTGIRYSSFNILLN